MNTRPGFNILTLHCFLASTLLFCDRILSKKFKCANTILGNFQNTHCEWLIQPNRSKAGLQENEPYFISLVFSQMNTECAYDYVFVYDGNTPENSILLGSFSGKSFPPKLISESGALTIVLFSDTNYVLEGFRAEFSVTPCPMNCSRHGVCQSHSCTCDKNWTGNDCSVPLCSENCGSSSGRGKCSTDGSRCECHVGFSGDDCSIDENNFIGNTWHFLSRGQVGPFFGRTSHASIYDDASDSLFLYGGFDLNNILGDLLVYKFQEAQWSSFDFEQSTFVTHRVTFKTITLRLIHIHVNYAAS